MRKFSVVVSSFGLFLVSSCSSNSVTSAYLQDGSQAFMANCSGAGRTWANCEFEAGEECGKRGFDVIAKTSEPYSVGKGRSGLYGGQGVAGQGNIVVGSSNTYSESSNARYLTFSCRGEEEQSLTDKLIEQSKETSIELFEKGKEAGKDLIDYIDKEL